MNTHVRERERCVRTFEMVETEALRPRIEAAIESLLALLDEIDGDADQEMDEDEEDDSPEDGGDLEHDIAEWGVADRDALDLILEDICAKRTLDSVTPDWRREEWQRANKRLSRKLRPLAKARRARLQANKK